MGGQPTLPERAQKVVSFLFPQVEFDAAVVSAEALVEAVEDAGFDGALLSVKHPAAGLQQQGQQQGQAQVRASQLGQSLRTRSRDSQRAEGRAWGAEVGG